MAQFSVNPQRFDPYKNFKFRVKWDGRYVARRQQGVGAQAKHRGGRTSPLSLEKRVRPKLLSDLPPISPSSSKMFRLTTAAG
jgi:hypothetical protein